MRDNRTKIWPNKKRSKDVYLWKASWIGRLKPSSWLLIQYKKTCS